VGDEVLAGAAALVGVALARKREGLGDGIAIELIGGFLGVLLDPGEEGAEQRPLGLRQLLCRLGYRNGGRALAARGPDAGMATTIRRTSRTVRRALGPRGLQLACLRLFRYRTPSW
jgi:hypothetical protein